jgi:hypothetical protein
MTKSPKIRRFAEGTDVPVDRSRQEIEKLCRAHGASGFASSWDKSSYCIMFELRGRRVRFDVGAPDTKTYRDTKRWEAEERRRWRALLLILKAKLELVASGDTDFEAEFLANLVLRGGQTLGSTFLPTLTEVLDTGTMPKMLTAGTP